MVKLHIKTSKIGATATSDNVRKGRTYVLLGILFFQNSGGAGVGIPLGGRVPPLSSIPPWLGYVAFPCYVALAQPRTVCKVSLPTHHQNHSQIRMRFSVPLFRPFCVLLPEISGAAVEPIKAFSQLQLLQNNSIF